MIVRSLSIPECTRLLQDNRLGRLACCKEGQPYVVPIHYSYGDSQLYVFSMPGKKIDWMRENPRVSIVVEQQGTAKEWRSVIVNGRFEELPDRIGHKRERERAWALLSRHADWWEPGGLKPVASPASDKSPHLFFRIAIDEIFGREGKEE